MNANFRKAAIIGCGSVGAAMEITAGTYDDLADCALVVITAGVNQKPGETRLELIERNAAILQGILGEITTRSFGGILLIVSNPVDVLTYTAWKLSGLPRERVIGSGTVLDTARLKQLLGEELGVDTRSSSASMGTASWRCGAAQTFPGWIWTTSAGSRAKSFKAALWSGCTGRYGTALTRSSGARGPLTTALPWRWAALRSAS